MHNEGKSPVYSASEIAAVVLDFLTFLTTLHRDPGNLMMPPPGGWPSYTPENCAADDRAVLPAITGAGRDLLRLVAPGHVSTVREVFLDLLCEDDVERLAEVMNRARDHLRSPDGETGG